MPITAYKAKSTTDLLNLRALEQPNDPAIYTGIPEPDNSIKLRFLTYTDILKAVDRLSWHYQNALITHKVAPGEIPPVHIISVLVTSAIDETLLELALAKIGLTALLLSVNNSVPAIAHLTKLTKASHLIYSEKFAEEAIETQTLLKEQGIDIGLVKDKRFPLWGPEGVANSTVEPFSPPLTPDQETHRPAVILHSSGSTGFPKPVYITHYGLIANGAITHDNPGFSTLPVFHGYGHFVIFRCMYPGKPMTLFPPHLPLTSANICTVHAISPPTRQCFAVPYVIKLLGETEEGIKMMASFDIVSYAGAPVPDDLGTRLVAAGVNLLSNYGTTETGTLMISNRDFKTDKNWNWVCPTELSKSFLKMEPHGNNTFEVVVVDGYPPKIESNRPDKSFTTKDLVLRHPEHDNWYKYIGRLDDTLVHILGEKTNPVPIELSIRGNSPFVAEAIIFGAGKPQTGCLILPSDLAKDLSRAEIMEKVWPVIEQANTEAPTHSRLLPEMIEILPYGTDIPVATKMSILRPACYVKFKDLIESVYARFEEGSPDFARLDLDKPELEQFLLDAIIKTLGATKALKLDKQMDLFSFGVDSLQATRIRNLCQKELKLGGQTLSQNVVYEHPSVEKLSDYILSLKSVDHKPSADQHEAKMLGAVDKWKTKLTPRTSDPNAPPKPTDAHVIVLTGATGSLGAHILYQLVSSSAVRKVICLSRAGSHNESQVRVQESLRLRKLSPVAEEKVEYYASNYNAPFLGLTEKEYAVIRDQVTDVIHNAWPVNFILSIDSYSEHIGGAVNLMNLCLQSPYYEPAAFYFSSSISCRQGSPEPTCPENYPLLPATASGTGYARSKWVVEKLCQAAADLVGLPVGVLRIGQMVGDSVNGVWNETEAWPLLFKSANTIGALPALDENPSWLPVDHAGRGIAEIVLKQQTQQSAVYHIVNPDASTSWADILDVLESAGLKFSRVDPHEWVELLASSDQDGARNPAIKLLSFFRMRWSGERQKPMVFLTHETSKVAPTIRTSPPLTKELIDKWVAHWRETGFFV